MSRIMKRKVFLLIVVSLLLLLNGNAFSENKKQDTVVFKGRVTDISQKHITIGRTNIALPKEVRCLDAAGNPIQFEMIKKGDHAIVQVDKGKALITRSSGAAKTEDERDIPR